MSSSHDTSSFASVTKVGAVILRTRADGEQEVLVVQPRPKPATPEDLPPQGMVRGTRKYWEEETQSWVDADHDGKTQPPANAVFEPVEQTMKSEVEEEAGIGPKVLETQRTEDMGVRIFDSKKKGPYPIHWFVIELDKHAQKLVDANLDASLAGYNPIKDSLSAAFFTLAEFKELVAEKKASPGYIPVIEEAMDLMRSRPAQTHREMAVR